MRSEPYVIDTDTSSELELRFFEIQVALLKPPLGCGYVFSGIFIISVFIWVSTKSIVK